MSETHILSEGVIKDIIAEKYNVTSDSVTLQYFSSEGEITLF